MDSINRAVEGLLRSYEEAGGINHRSGANLPSTESVVRIVQDLETLAFPGYRREDGIDDSNVGYMVGELAHRVAGSLVAEIERSLEYAARLEGKDGCPAACHLEARDLALAFLEDLPGLRRLLMTDVAAAFAGDPAARSVEEVILAYPGLEAVTVHRFAHWFWSREVPLIPRMMAEYVHRKTGIDIHPGAEIGERFFIDHGTGVVIGETCVIGAGVKVYQGVTLGALSVRKETCGQKRHPTIGDGVTIYSGATILGGATVIGPGSIVGGNVWLTRSVPAGTRVYAPQGEPVIHRAEETACVEGA